MKITVYVSSKYLFELVMLKQVNSYECVISLPEYEKRLQGYRVEDSILCTFAEVGFVFCRFLKHEIFQGFHGTTLSRCKQSCCFSHTKIIMVFLAARCMLHILLSGEKVMLSVRVNDKNDESKGGYK